MVRRIRDEAFNIVINNECLRQLFGTRDNDKITLEQCARQLDD